MCMPTGLKGFRQALADHQLDFDPDNLIVNDLSAQDGKECGQKNSTNACRCQMAYLWQMIPVQSVVCWS